MLLCRDELVTKNIRLVYYMYNKLHMTDIVKSYKEDIISEGMIGLINAANNFDESKNFMFATYAAMCIHNQMLMCIRKLKRFYGKEISLYQPINIDYDGNELCYADLIEAKGVPQDALVTVMSFKEFLVKQKKRNRIIYIAHCKGYKQREIGKALKLSQSYVSRLVKKIKAQLEEEML